MSEPEQWPTPWEERRLIVLYIRSVVLYEGQQEDILLELAEEIEEGYHSDDESD